MNKFAMMIAAVALTLVAVGCCSCAKSKSCCANCTPGKACVCGCGLDKCTCDTACTCKK